MGQEKQNSPAPGARWALRVTAAIIVLIAVALRLALLGQGKAGVDARECMTAMKARSFVAGKAPEFNMPFARDEIAAVMVSPLLAAGGYSERSIKIIALALWLFIAAGAAAAARAAFGERTAWVTFALMISSPTVALWSLKLRAGQVLSLLFLAVTLLLIFQLLALGPGNKKMAASLASAAGVFAVLAAALNPLALAPAALLLVTAPAVAAMNRQWMAVPSIAIGAVLTGALIAFLSPDNLPWTPLFESAAATGSLATRLPAAALAFFTPHLDANLLDQPEQDPIAIVVRGLAAIVWTATVAAAVIQNASRRPGSFKSRDFVARAVLVAGVAAAAVFVIGAASSRFVPRHFLALYPLTAILTAYSIEQWLRERPAMGRTILIALIVTGLAVSATLFGRTSIYNPGQPAGIALESTGLVIESLKRHGVKRVFSADPEYEWNLMFESGGEIVARSWDPADACRRCVEAVNDAVLAGEPTAIVVPAPDLPERRFLIDSVEDGPHDKTDWPAADVAILYGVPADYVFLYFARSGK